MQTIDVAGVLCWCLMSVAFVTARGRLRALNVACAILLLLTAHVCASSAHGVRDADAIAILAGLLLYWFGLLAVRTMLRRSVSLHMLVCYGVHQTDPVIDDRIAERMDEAVRYRLLATRSETYGLTLSGRALSHLLAQLYRTLRID